jgi:hypothetical protein
MECKERASLENWLSYTGRMTVIPDLAGIRLWNQWLSHPIGKSPEGVVRHLVAMQAQDFFGAKWAIGLRMSRAVDADIEDAFMKGHILRTHVMRPTWHFVAAEDIRWLLNLTVPRVHLANGSMYRQTKLDAKILAKAHSILGKALAERNLTRSELKTKLASKNIKTDNLRLAYIMMHAELEGLICSGPRRGKQFTYVLLDQRAPKVKELSRDETLAEFVLRFFAARGPATIQDFSYWSGLTIADGNAGVLMVRKQLNYDEPYWFVNEKTNFKHVNQAYLLPNYDEFGMSYKDHGVSLNDEQKEQTQNYSFSQLIVINGQLKGTWRRSQKETGVEIEFWPFMPFSQTERKLVDAAIEKYEHFLQRPVRVI